MSIAIKRMMRAAYPEHDHVFSRLKTIPKLAPRNLSLPEAVVRVVTGQMLSGAVAEVIYRRISAAAVQKQLTGSWQLDYDTLRYCGLSRSKAKSICEFGSKVGNDPLALNHWRALDVDSLIDEIKSNRGMGDWTAGIVALFYVGHEDVFPSGDGSLNRAIESLQRVTRKSSRRYRFDPNRARPYRSYLALYLWQALDSGLLE